MPEEQEGGTTLISLFNRLAAGDTSAADEIIAHAMERLKRLAHKRLKSFPAVRGLHETEDVVQGAAMRLYRALKAVPPTSVEQFLRLASTQIRRELIDLKRHEFGVNEDRVRVVLDPAQSPSQVGQLFDRPEKDATEKAERQEQMQEQMQELDKRVDNLPEDQRDVFEHVFYRGLAYGDVAQILGVSESTVKRRWYDALDTLKPLLSREG
jgi:RNA polymerase sigma-70 factor (ECF subfamily)